MSRYFIPAEQIDESAGAVTFLGRDAHHIGTVLRMRVGQTVYALDGAGNEYEAVLETVGKSSSIARIAAKRQLNTEPSVRITIAQALPKTLEKLEWVLQHGTEVGAAGFIVFESARGRQDGDRLAKKRDRWQEIVRSAAEQSHRALQPKVGGTVSFSDLLAGISDFDVVLLAYEGERGVGLREALPKRNDLRVLAIIGPEGGFTEEEVTEARKAGAIPITLGPRILRTETAGLVLLSQIVCLSEEHAK